MGGSILRWDIQSGDLIDTPFEFENDADLWSMAFHPNGQLLFTIFRRTYGNFMAWDMKTSLRLKDSFDYSYLNLNPATSFAFVEAKEIMAVGYADGQIIIWDTVALVPIMPPLQHAESTDIVRDIAFTPDAQTLVSVSDRGPIIIWDLSAFEFGIEGMIQRACQIVNRDMTLYEWQGFMGDAVPYERTCP